MGTLAPDAHETSGPIDRNRDRSQDEQLSTHPSAHCIHDDDRDDFGLPQSQARRKPRPPESEPSGDEGEETFEDAEDGSNTTGASNGNRPEDIVQTTEQVPKTAPETNTRSSMSKNSSPITSQPSNLVDNIVSEGKTDNHDGEGIYQVSNQESPTLIREEPGGSRVAGQKSEAETKVVQPEKEGATPDTPEHIGTSPKKANAHHARESAFSEWSHQRLAPREEVEDEDKEDDWQAMPAVADYDLYDDDGRLIARGVEEEDAEEAAYGGLGGAGKGYTRVQMDEDAQSATSMDDDTRYLFNKETNKHHLVDEDEQRDAVSQLEATKDLLTEGQRIAYVGVTRLTIYQMTAELETAESAKSTKKDLAKALESMTKWGQQMMVRLYQHMDIDSAEQVMIEQLAEHGVQPSDLVPPLMQNARVRNPMASPRPSVSSSSTNVNGRESKDSSRQSLGPLSPRTDTTGETEDEGVPEVHTPSQMTHDAKIELDLRWTVLCDLFLVLIADAAYDSRSRLLLEKVGTAMDVSWTQICRFEKRVIDALEMQEEKDQENWNEDEHLEARRKAGLKRKYVMMGIATVGGGLVIGLSAGLLAPVIGAGLAAGFTTIGVSGTAGFLGGVGGTALITSAATAAGGTIAIRASNRRTGHVKTFEYRPLHNNKRLNLILTVSGWMSGRVDDVRLPYSTVDPIMGDIYSLLWEPEMLQSMGDTINILATEALTQTIQQVLGSTILVALMASLQLPIVLTKLSYLIDNPWSVSLDRANAAGLILADSLIDRHLGNRPVTLVGFSLGSRLIFSCLRELANRGAYGLVQNVYLFGSPIVAKRDEYFRARTAVCGRFVNGYASNDWILGYLFRATSGGIMRVAGLAPVEGIPRLENVDVSSMVNGHMAYRAAMPRLLREVGWEVESDEFTEIEDADPEDHAHRQRELIREIDEARKEAEQRPEKKRFGFFKKGKLAQRKGWETYEQDNSAADPSMAAGGTEPNVLFDIEAIKRELESEMIEVKQLESTLPPMKLDISSADNPRDMLRQTKSSEGALQSQQSPSVPEGSAMPIRSKETEPVVGTRKSFTDSFVGSSKAADEDVSPSFERDFESPREIRSTLPPLTLPSFGALEATDGARDEPQANRPELKSSVTMPISSTSYSGFGKAIEHNAWADEDEDFGKEGEIKMTFE
ncbi:hypothetical protein UCRPC4_g04761 [Phaeomoniella chlamydospora]|uniref:DUF726 domain protein n=1 Tax=Phaeomoniella chlamydospora TaxID=158046 RepID=A0A0G2E8U6_PHACM|nr:hypothetical protein UCRPC4_g04761 [Phaeomoniella chlamydospora]